MTNEELKRKYPIGAKIKFLAQDYMCLTAREDNGKTGKVVEHWAGLIRIFLPESNNYWITQSCTIELIKVKGQQLLFAFMEE